MPVPAPPGTFLPPTQDETTLLQRLLGRMRSLGITLGALTVDRLSALGDVDGQNLRVRGVAASTRIGPYAPVGLGGVALLGPNPSPSSNLFAQAFLASGTTTAGAQLAVTFPQPFSKTVQVVIAAPGDNQNSLSQVQLIRASLSLSGFNCGCFQPNGTPINTLPVNVAVWAVGV